MIEGPEPLRSTRAGFAVAAGDPGGEAALARRLDRRGAVKSFAGEALAQHGEGAGWR